MQAKFAVKTAVKSAKSAKFAKFAKFAKSAGSAGSTKFAKSVGSATTFTGSRGAPRMKISNSTHRGILETTRSRVPEFTDLEAELFFERWNESLTMERIKEIEKELADWPNHHPLYLCTDFTDESFNTCTSCWEKEQLQDEHMGLCSVLGYHDEEESTGTYFVEQVSKKGAKKNRKRWNQPSTQRENSLERKRGTSRVHKKHELIAN
jgi:hypothetical protein